LGGLGAVTQPVQSALVVDADERRLLPGCVLPQDLDETAVARAAPVGDDDAVGRLLLLADAHQADLDGQNQKTPVREGRGSLGQSSGNPGIPPAGIFGMRPRLPFLPLRAMPGMPFIICCTCLNCFSSWLTSFVVT